MNVTYDGVTAEDSPETITDFVDRLADNDRVASANTSVEVTVREADTSVGTEVYVREYGNEGMWVDDSGDRPTMEGSGSDVSKAVQDIASDVFGQQMRVTQYEDDTCSETTITPTALPNTA